MKYLYIFNNEIAGGGDILCVSEGCQNVEVSDEIFTDRKKYIYKNNEIVLNPNWEEDQKKEQRKILDEMTLTPADVERALYKAKGMDFEDLKLFISQNNPDIDIKAIAIELKAKDFYRGAIFGNTRIFDVIGAMLGYSTEDIDYLFENKCLPR